MKKKYVQLLNPVKWLKAYRLSKKQGKYDKSKSDLELNLYSKILKNDMLHYGYFDDPAIAPETISIQAVEEAQINYAKNIIDLITHKDGLILDVGCGMGGLSGILTSEGYRVEAVTPNRNQCRHIQGKYKDVPVHNCKFEDVDESKKYHTVINSESFQYINLETGLKKIDAITEKGSKWIITDYFRLHNHGVCKSSHLLDDFIKRIEESNWKITHTKDITPNILPMLRFLRMYIDRFVFPVKHFAFEKFKYKQGFLYYLTQDLLNGIDGKIEKEVASIDPVRFENEKKYMMFVLERVE
ncbi:MAG TPA: class I SAM-dependent methyltransferase [Paludibacter sp.]|nr:class I SAM-dependent methyltransferase [Paludibacter sp.]